METKSYKTLEDIKALLDYNTSQEFPMSGKLIEASMGAACADYLNHKFYLQLTAEEYNNLTKDCLYTDLLDLFSDRLKTKDETINADRKRFFKTPLKDNPNVAAFVKEMRNIWQTLYPLLDLPMNVAHRGSDFPFDIRVHLVEKLAKAKCDHFNGKLLTIDRYITVEGLQNLLVNTGCATETKKGVVLRDMWIETYKNAYSEHEDRYYKK